MLWRDVDDLLVTSLVGELDNAGNQGEQRVVAADANVTSRKHLGATLAHNDRAGHYGLTAKALYPASLGIRVTSVL